MIRSFADEETSRIWEGQQSRKLPSHIQNIARRKLRMINNAASIYDLRIPPANRLEKLKGDLTGYYSVRINKKWRIIFKWKNSDAFEVQIIDYHG